MPDETNTTPVNNGVGTTLPPVTAGAADDNQDNNQNVSQDAAAVAKAATAAATKSVTEAEPAPVAPIPTKQAADPIVQAKPTQATQKETPQTGPLVVQRAVLQNIQEAKNVLVALSADPSVDEMAAAIGLTLFLDNLGKRATAIYSGETPNALEFLKPDEMFEPSADTLQDFVIALNKDKADHLRYKLDGDFVKIYITPYRAKIEKKDLEFTYGDYNVDLVLALDVTNGADLDDALREHGRIMHDAVIINITTGKPGKFGEIEWNDGRASSVSEMIARLLYGMEGETKIEKEEATAFLTGIVAATNRFSNARTVPETLQIAAKLMASGANQQLISRHITPEVDNELTEAMKREQKVETPVKKEAPEEEGETDPTKLEIGHVWKHRKSIDKAMEEEEAQVKEEKAQLKDEVAEAKEVKPEIKKDDVGAPESISEKEEEVSKDKIGEEDKDKGSTEELDIPEEKEKEEQPEKKEDQETEVVEGELSDDLKEAAASLATAGTETVPTGDKPLKIDSDTGKTEEPVEEPEKVAEEPEKTAVKPEGAEEVSETVGPVADETPEETVGSVADEAPAAETPVESAEPTVPAKPAEDAAPAAPAEPVASTESAAPAASAKPAAPVAPVASAATSPAEAVFKLPELNTAVLPKEKESDEEGFVSDKPEKVIQPSANSGGDSGIGGEKYEKMLEDALEGGAGANPVVAQAPAVPNKPEINGVPEINYMPMPGDTVLPPPPTPPIGAGAGVPAMPPLTPPVSAAPETPAAPEAPNPASTSTETPGAFKIPGT